METSKKVLFVATVDLGGFLMRRFSRRTDGGNTWQMRASAIIAEGVK